jgi:hypothetical protein
MSIVRGEVIEVYNDLTSLTTEKLDQLLGRAAEPSYLPRLSSPDVVVLNMPRDSLRVRILSDNFSIICYPFFPSHLRLPTKVGEEVWVMLENLESLSPTLFDPEKVTNRTSVKDVVMNARNPSSVPKENISLGYWMCRPTNERQVEDLNYTAFGRTKYASGFTMVSAADIQQNAARADRTPTFPYYSNTSNQLERVEKDDDLLRQRIEGFFDRFALEPVARYTKNPGEAVLAGSNDSRIVLGQTRSGRPGKGPADTGAVDIVAGTGRSATAPNVVANKYGQEVEKDPLLTGKQDVASEGDPDFKNDLSRVLVAESIAVDQEFSAPVSSSTLDVGDKTGPAIIARSQHIRILGSNDGSVRIVVEGPTQSNILIDASGNIQIEAQQVFLGTTSSPTLTGGIVGGSDFLGLLAALFTDLETAKTPVVGQDIKLAFPTLYTKLSTIAGQGFRTIFSKSVFASR